MLIVLVYLLMFKINTEKRPNTNLYVASTIALIAGRWEIGILFVFVRKIAVLQNLSSNNCQWNQTDEYPSQTVTTSYF